MKRQRREIEIREMGFYRRRIASEDPDTWSDWTCLVCGCSVNMPDVHRTVCQSEYTAERAPGGTP